jgi:drug/metabolite transporter (DMT)-like permease
MYVVLVPIYALALRKRAPLNVWISVGIAAVGFYLLCIKDGFTMVPSDTLVMICSLIFPVHILLIDRLSPLCDGIRMSMVQFATCTLLNLVIALIAERGEGGVGALLDCLPAVIFLGIGSSGVAYTLQIIGQRGVNPAAASIILSLESVFGVIGTAVFLGTRLELREYLGCAVVLVAVILSQLELPRRGRADR